ILYLTVTYSKMVKGYSSISLKNTLVERLEAIQAKETDKHSEQKFATWLTNILYQLADYHETLNRYGPFLEFIDARENRINLVDHRKNKPVMIYINADRKELQCDLDNKSDCIHIGFCYAIPEVYKALIDHGFRPPKKT
ncbi:MAG: hypothetical protein WAM88_14235, partial [Nitrososphaeraceae archaeon]